MTTWTVPATINPQMATLTAANTSATTQATPLAWSKMAQKGLVKPAEVNKQVVWALWGDTGGCLGETSSIAFFIGGAYLLIRRTITWHIPAAVLLSAGAIALATWLIKPDVYVILIRIIGGEPFPAVFQLAVALHERPHFKPTVPEKQGWDQSARAHGEYFS